MYPVSNYTWKCLVWGSPGLGCCSHILSPDLLLLAFLLQSFTCSPVWMFEDRPSLDLFLWVSSRVSLLALHLTKILLLPPPFTSFSVWRSVKWASVTEHSESSCI